jgi:hypothetical protein
MRERRLGHKWRVAVAALAVAASVAIGTPAAAGTTDVVASGECSAGSHWRLRLHQEDNRIGVVFRVRQGVVGDLWRVAIWQNGELILRGHRVTRPPNGAFRVRTVTRNTEGVDTFRARAANQETGEVCRGRAAI